METSALIADLARDLVRIDSRSAVSNLAIADRLESELGAFEIERLDYKDAAGINKCVLVASRGRGGLVFSGHMDTVPETGWTTDPWSGRIEGDALHGLGSTDMKGPLASLIGAATLVPPEVPLALFLTTDEETTKRGANLIARRSTLARSYEAAGIVIAEPTGMVPVRAHRSHIEFTAVATGVQAHSATGRGTNANWALVAFMSEMAALHERLRTDPALQDADYDPPFSDFNPVIDNHGAALNVAVPQATVRIRYRYSAGVDPEVVAGLVADAAARHGLAVTEARGAPPPHLAADHALVALATRVTGRAPVTMPFGTDASELQALAPCVVLGPGDIAVAHAPGEQVSLAALRSAADTYARLAAELAQASA